MFDHEVYRQSLPDAPTERDIRQAVRKAGGSCGPARWTEMTWRDKDDRLWVQDMKILDVFVAGVMVESILSDSVNRPPTVQET